MDEKSLVKAAQGALDWFENKYPEHMTATRLNNVMRDLRAALTKPVAAQPYAYERDGSFIPAWHCTEPPPGWTTLYTAPVPAPQRKWVELEDDEVTEIADRCTDVFGLADLISEALRAKNEEQKP